MLKSFRSAALLAAALACATPAAAANLKATVSQAFQSMLYLPLYVALDEGLFEKAGIDVTKETAGAPSVALSAVISKSAQFSLHGPEWTAVAASKGAPVNIICNVVNGAAVWIAAAPDFPFKEAKDLKGQTIVAGLMPTTSTSLFLKYLKENGMTKDDVNITQVQIGTEPGPFLAGQAKVAVMYEPGLDQAVAKGMKVLVGFPQHYGAYAFSAISARKDVDPATAQAFVNGLQAALVLMKTDQAKAIAVAKKEFPTLDPAVVEAAVKRMMSEKVYPETADISPDALKVGLDTQIALGNLAAQPDYATFVRRSFIEKAIAGN
ncbi:ABC transporter substrate-binding protein [Methylobacterium brachythecii]|uniref:ABC transporter substrate-binding protein n=1 Tax=Methylobacterium brachythecii TaxID=1176177 RepID=A0A7W6AKU5_9HYPH|nr:ABC transporter substrate-binding protein [Methylobacterium brachythecii]MBB3903029.1 NitT/TauT family transport system substrate-binding protein [Methylobacterium brachythecii]GLS45734.1 ABC transporter substrate-binding protein [Methylobacterium brachythecii]